MATALVLAAGGSLAADAEFLEASPFPARPAPRGPTLFAPLAPERTHVTVVNRYDDPRMWGALYQEFEGGSIGTGVAIGDYDGDGRPDLFVATKTDGCRLYRNLGNYCFEDVTEKAGVGAEKNVWNEGVTFVDINNDGRLDIYVCRFNAPNLLYVNQGDGSFKEMAHQYGLDVKDSSVMACFCDYDRDGRLDVYITTNIVDATAHPGGQRGHLLHNNGNGTFTDVTEAAGISGESQSHSATWWDFDDDGWPDLYVANDYGVPDKLYRNNRDGTFTNVTDQVLPRTSYYSMGSDQGDVDNDGRIDLLVADMAATTRRKDQHSIAESRERSVDWPASTTPKYPRSALYLNTGAGRCLEAAQMAGISATDWTWSVRFEDLDNDGRLDLFVTNGFNRDPNPDVNSRSMNVESTAERIRLLKDTPVQEERHLAFRNKGDLAFEEVSAAWGLDQKGVGFGAAFGDLGGTGNLDLVYTNYEGAVSILRNDCDTGHRINVDLRGSASNRFGVGAVVRVESALGVQVRQLVLARGYLSSSEPMLHFGLGSDSVVRRMTVTWPSGWEQVFDNLAVDRRYQVSEPAGRPPAAVVRPPIPPLFAAVSAAGALAPPSREEEIDETYLQKLIPLRLNRRGPALAVADLLDNGREEAVIGATTVDPQHVVAASASGFYAAADGPVVRHPPADDGPLLLLDVAGRGRADLLVTRGGNTLPEGAPEYQPRLYFNKGQGDFEPAPEGALPPLAINAGALAAADFDHSGRLGVFIGGRMITGRYPHAPQSALLANRGGRFEDVTDAVAPGLRTVGMVTGAVWSDLDGDGWPDLVLTLDWGGVKYFHNDGGRRLEDWSERAGFAAAGTGWWTSIAEGDFNGDGRPDFVVGNLGLNTPYHADVEHPALLYAGDFRDNGSEQLVEAAYDQGTLYPVRSRRGLAAGIPWILKRFPSNEAYARASLVQVFGEARLAKATRFAATELRSGVFLSQPDGTYRFEPLPRMAQISPLQGLVAGDFGGPAHADVFAVQNSYAPIPSVGRFNGGLGQLLFGDGHGHFRAVPPAESGLVVPGDAKALAVCDLFGDGWPVFLATRNNGTPLAFRPRPHPDERPLKVVLRGKPGNPTAVGALVTAELAGVPVTTEIHAGSGYLSQSSAACYLRFSRGSAPAKIRVRWPSGAASEAAVGPAQTVLVLSEP